LQTAIKTLGVFVFVIAILLALPIATPGPAAEQSAAMTISGVIRLAPENASDLAPNDRLVLKLFHPDEGIEKDARYWIIDQPTFPTPFEIAPSVDMNGKTRWSTYQLEAFTDRDGDVQSLAEGELFGRSDGLLPLGAEGLTLELSDPAR
jgi:hypothetical protein